MRELEISQEQIEFAGTVNAAVALCTENDESELAGLTVVCDSVVVGFLLVKRSGQAPQWVPGDAAVITALRIGAEYQGRGLGTAAIELLPAWTAANWPDTQQLVLAVDEDNVAGIKSYTKAGWRDHGVRLRGRVGWERRMTLPLTSRTRT